MALHAVYVLLLVYISAVNAVSVTTKLGVINGEAAETKFAGNTYNVHRYLGIPYAQPPTGKLRFQKPKPALPFDEPFDALKDGPICPQVELDMFPPTSTFGMSEDCLYLNVFVPDQKPDQPSGHAVLFFIHGGGFTLGSGSWLRGDTLASVGNVIVVTINYRLGLFGLLDMDDDRAPGNYGFWDQHQALRWVNENIEAFGGDKDRVVIFGESAGSASVTLQMLYTGNKGLFYGGIAESGTAFMPIHYPQNTIMPGKAYAKLMNCSAETNDEVFDCLMSCSPDDVVTAIQDLFTRQDMAVMMEVAMMPSIDGDFLKSPVFDLFEAAKTEKVEEVEFCRSIKLINGINAKEGTMFVMMQCNNSDDCTVSRESMNAQIPGLSSMVFGPTQVVPEVVIKLLQSEYTDWTGPDDPEKLRDQLVRFYGDVYFNAPGVAFSLAHANSSSSESYVYLFKAFLWKSPLPRAKWMTEPNHGDDLLPVFGYDGGELINKTDKESVPEWEFDMSKRIMIYWSNFAKTGDPNKAAIDTQSSGTWPLYKVDTQKYLILNKEDSLGQFLFAREADFWNNIIPAVMKAVEHPETISATYSSNKDGSCEKDGGCDG